MGTTAKLLVLGSDKLCRAIFVEFDGYLSAPGVGDVLSRLWRSQEAADLLVSLGSRETLPRNCGPTVAQRCSKHGNFAAVAAESFEGADAALNIGYTDFTYRWNGARWEVFDAGALVPDWVSLRLVMSKLRQRQKR